MRGSVELHGLEFGLVGVGLVGVAAVAVVIVVGVAGKMAEVIKEKVPDADITIVNGGQPVYFYMIAAESL